MKTITRDFHNWRTSIPGAEKPEKMYMRGKISFEEYIMALVDLREKQKDEEWEAYVSSGH